MAVNTFRGYNNEVLSNYIQSIIETKLDVNRYMTPDYRLTEDPGMIRTIHTYVGSGAVDDLNRGDGQTNWCDSEYVEEKYVVKRSQAATRYYDDDYMTDPVWVEDKVQTVAEVMYNDWTNKAFAEFAKTLQTAEFTNWSFDDFVDAIGQYANIHETQEGLFFLCAMDLVPKIRKQLNENLKYVEAYVRQGAIGEICGVPIYPTVALHGVMYLADKQAVTAFFKKDIFVEQDRDVETKLNRIFASRYTVIALTDGTRCIECGAKQATTATVTTATKATTTVAGAATTGAKVQVYVNGVASGAAVTAASNAYSATVADNLVAGDKVFVVATLAGKIKSVSEVFTVAE